MKMLDYLLNTHFYLWQLVDLENLIDFICKYEILDVLPLILKGKALINTILPLSFDK